MATQEHNLRKRLTEIYIDICRGFYFEGSDEKTEREEFAPEFVDKIEHIIRTESMKARNEGKLDACIQLDPYIDPDFREQYEFIFSVLETKQAELQSLTKQERE